MGFKLGQKVLLNKTSNSLTTLITNKDNKLFIIYF